MKPTIQECYSAGSIIDISVTLTAYHGGHFEFHACPINHGEVPSESCFKDHPLELVEDVLNGAPKDPNYPSRAYIHGLTSMTLGEFKYKYKLPDNLIGELVLIQWYYITGNTCTDEGYADYPFPVGFTPFNAGEATTATCPLPITGDGSEAPERVSYFQYSFFPFCREHIIWLIANTARLLPISSGTVPRSASLKIAALLLLPPQHPPLFVLQFHSPN